MGVCAREAGAMRQEVASARRSPEAEPASFADGLGVRSEREMCGSFQDVAAAVCHLGTGSGGSRGGGARSGCAGTWGRLPQALGPSLLSLGESRAAGRQPRLDGSPWDPGD